MAMINVIVNDGVVQLWGLVGSGTEKKVAQVSAENIPGVKAAELSIACNAPLTRFFSSIR